MVVVTWPSALPCARRVTLGEPLYLWSLGFLGGKPGMPEVPLPQAHLEPSTDR